MIVTVACLFCAVILKLQFYLLLVFLKTEQLCKTHYIYPNTNSNTTSNIISANRYLRVEGHTDMQILGLVCQ